MHSANFFSNTKPPVTKTFINRDYHENNFCLTYSKRRYSSSRSAVLVFSVRVEDLKSCIINRELGGLG